MDPEKPPSPPLMPPPSETNDELASEVFRFLDVEYDSSQDNPGILSPEKEYDGKAKSVEITPNWIRENLQKIRQTMDAPPPPPVSVPDEDPDSPPKSKAQAAKRRKMDQRAMSPVPLAAMPLGGRKRSVLEPTPTDVYLQPKDVMGARKASSRSVSALAAAAAGRSMDTKPARMRYPTTDDIARKTPVVMDPSPILPPIENVLDDDDSYSMGPTGKGSVDVSESSSGSGGSGITGESRKRQKYQHRTRRIDWTPELHKRFLRALDELGEKSAVPKAITRHMNVEGLTREKVASHLQKFRMSVKKSHVMYTTRRQHGGMSGAAGDMHDGGGAAPSPATHQLKTEATNPPASKAVGVKDIATQTNPPECSHCGT